jgi:hypothetical protein
MRAPCQALVLEDDPEQMAAITGAMREVYLEPLACRTPDQALNKLVFYQPVLAVLDLDMSLAPDHSNSVDDVLLRLYQYFGGCFLLVYSVRSDDILERKRIEAVHPLAMFVSKQDGVDKLVDRIRRLMGVRFGDLIVKQGMTFHEPSGDVYPHRIGVSLILGATLNQEVVLDDTDAKAARRMKAWLESVGSNVRIVDHGRRCYALHVVDRPEEWAGGGTALA